MTNMTESMMPEKVVTGSITPVLQTHKSNGQACPDTTFTDAGYSSAPALQKAQADGYELCAPIGAPPHSGQRFGTDVFEVDLPHRHALCPAGKTNTQCSYITEKEKELSYYYFAWNPKDCASCPLQSNCLSKKKNHGFRTLQVGEHHMIVQARRKLCKTPEYQKRMRRRNGIEGTNSECKRAYGMRNCRYRGLQKTDLQMQMTGAACNLRRWAKRLVWLERKNKAQNN